MEILLEINYIILPRYYKSTDSCTRLTNPVKSSLVLGTPGGDEADGSGGYCVEILVAA